MISQDIKSDTTWDVNGSPYIVSGTLYVLADLTIEPGVIIKHEQDSYLRFQNAQLTATGTVDEPIIFTSMKDDVGGDTNGDGSATSPVSGDYGIAISLYNPDAILDHVTIKFAEKGISSFTHPFRNTSKLFVSNTKIISSSQDGINVSGHVQFDFVDGMILDSGGAGIDVGNSEEVVLIKDNLISGNAEDGLYLSLLSDVTLSNNEITNNGEDGIYMSGGSDDLILIENNHMWIMLRGGFYCVMVGMRRVMQL